MTTPGPVELVVQFAILDYERWRSVARECVEHVAAREPDTLAYDWYVDPDRERGRLVERYASADAFREHLTGPVFRQIGPRFGRSIAWRSVEVFGTPPPELHDILGGLPITLWGRPTLAAERSR